MKLSVVEIDRQHRFFQLGDAGEKSRVRPSIPRSCFKVETYIASPSILLLKRLPRPNGRGYCISALRASLTPSLRRSEMFIAPQNH